MGIWTGFSPIGAAACVRLLSRAVPTVDACVVRLMLGGGVGNRRFCGDMRGRLLRVTNGLPFFFRPTPGLTFSGTENMGFSLTRLSVSG